MGARPAKTFPAPGAYAISSPTNVVTQTQPEQILPPQQFLDPGSYGSSSAVPTPATPVRHNGGGGRGKFFGDDFDPSLYGGGGQRPQKPIFPPPVKKPHLPPGGTLTAYKIDSGY